MKENKKKYLLIGIGVVVIIALVIGYVKTSSSNQETPQEESEINFYDAKVGEYINFGKYEQDDNKDNGSEAIVWLVLEKNNDGLLLISEKCLDSVKYSNSKEKTDWENSFVRKWLNDHFYENAFNETEKKYIVTTNNTIEYASTKVSKDKVFLLSSIEAVTYFEEDEDRQAFATPYAISQGVKAYEDGSCWWWLRSVCEDNAYAMNVRSAGNLRYSAEIAVDEEGYGIRPCLWVSYTAAQTNTSQSTNTSNSKNSSAKQAKAVNKGTDKDQKYTLDNGTDAEYILNDNDNIDKIKLEVTFTKPDVNKLTLAAIKAAVNTLDGIELELTEKGDKLNAVITVIPSKVDPNEIDQFVELNLISKEQAKEIKDVFEDKLNNAGVEDINALIETIKLK